MLVLKHNKYQIDGIQRDDLEKNKKIKQYIGHKHYFRLSKSNPKKKEEKPPQLQELK